MLFPFRGSRAHNSTPCLPTQTMDAPLNTLKRIIHAIQEPFLHNPIYSKATFLSSRGRKDRRGTVGNNRGKARARACRFERTFVVQTQLC